MVTKLLLIAQSPCSRWSLKPGADYNEIFTQGADMPIQTTANIWHNGKLIPWDKAQIHVMSHVVHYGSSVFEGIRCYKQPSGAGVFRLTEHMQRLADSAKIYRMPLPYTVEQLSAAVIDVIEANGIAPCYIRPIAFRGYGEIGVNPLTSPVDVYIANFPWGKYVPGNQGADVCVSSWSRLAPNTMPSLAKAGANYMNSQLIRMEAEVNGYSEGIALDVNGYLSEGSGENLFLVRNGVIYTTPLANSVLSGITRNSVITLARQLGIDVVEQALPRELLYIADEAFFTGTAAEVTHLRSVDRILVGDGSMGPITTALHEEFFGIVNGLKADRYNWLTPVNVKAAEPVGA
jgi:branched-chain amino acid aminotransferase